LSPAAFAGVLLLECPAFHNAPGKTGAPNQRKLLRYNDFPMVQGAPPCRKQFGSGRVEGRAVEAAFNAGLVGPRRWSAARQIDPLVQWIDLQTILAIVARADLIEHTIATWVRQRVFGIARGHQDLNDHDDMRRDPVTGVRRWPANRR
jgi:hypothetical protein